jgi:hypothetical protein
MSLGTFLLIILVIILLGGFSGVRRRPVLRDRPLRWWQPRSRPRYCADISITRQTLISRGSAYTLIGLRCSFHVSRPKGHAVF